MRARRLRPSPIPFTPTLIPRVHSGNRNFSRPLHRTLRVSRRACSTFDPTPIATSCYFLECIPTTENFSRRRIRVSRCVAFPKLKKISRVRYFLSPFSFGTKCNLLLILIILCLEELHSKFARVLCSRRGSTTQLRNSFV